MSLQFIIGPAGSGKSHVLFSEVVEHAASHPEQTHLVLVPDQFTMQAQRKLVSLSPKRGILNIEALSFERLAYRIFEELGTDTSNVLEDTGKSLLLRKITNDLKEELVALSSGIDKAGFIDELKSLFSEFAQYAISPEDLGHFLHAPNMGKAFYQRISDIQKIYTAYEAALQDNYITTEQILTLLSDVADKSLFLKNAYMAFDGYTGFTPVQKKLFLKMLCLADKIRVSITMDPSPERDGKGMAGLFHMSREFQSGMRRLADEAQVPVEAAIILSSTGGRRFVKNGCLAHLEANLFRRNPVEMDEKTRLLAADEVRLFATDRGRDELVLAASEIRRRIQENPDLRFRDFAVLCADIEEYRYTIEEVFGAYEIPVFVDAKDVALRSSFVETVAAIVHLFVADFSYEAVMRLLKGGFLPIETEEIDLLDNYLLATGLRGKGRLGRVFDRQADGISAEDMVRLNETRLMLMDPFLEEGLFLSSDTMEGYVRCLYGRIVELDCEAQLWKEADRLEEQGDSESASRTLQVYPKVMDLFDKMVRLMGSVEVSLEEFESILLEGLSAIKIGVIPPSLDSVTFGDMERTRVSEIDTLFLIGMSDGRIPGHLEDGGLLLQSERERLIEDYRIELAPTARERAFRQRFYLYLALCRPARSLILSYSKTPEDGVSMGECYLFPMIRELFCGISVQEISEEERMFSALSEAALPERMADGLREYMKGALPQEKEALFAAFLNEIRERDEKAYDGLLAAGGFLYTGARIPAAVMKALQKNELAVSASRLEQ
ncbi:MAG: exodeoxyribonuclease V subunit gamma, partial [Lachnospiraceae bacterium]|nr:exodeoxyribonuclease V subunit gamma [Lachnospiraceae bacterium]